MCPSGFNPRKPRQSPPESLGPVPCKGLFPSRGNSSFKASLGPQACSCFPHKKDLPQGISLPLGAGMLFQIIILVHPQLKRSLMGKKYHRYSRNQKGGREGYDNENQSMYTKEKSESCVIQKNNETLFQILYCAPPKLKNRREIILGREQPEYSNPEDSYRPLQTLQVPPMER